MAILPTIVLTPEHLIHAEVETADRRLLDVVNDRRTDYFHLQAAAIYRRGGAEHVATASDVVIPKRSLALLAPAGENHEAPRNRCNKFTRKKEFEAFLIVLGFEIFGKLYLTGSGDPAGTLMNELTAFFPVCQAEVCFRDVYSGTDPLSVVLVNSAYVSLLRIGDSFRPARSTSSHGSETATRV